MDRTRFYNLVTVDEQQEFDYLWSNFNKFQLTDIPSHYRLSQVDLMRPDLVSYKMYSTVKYWWVLCLVNEVSDVLTGMSVGDVWVIPAISDIYDFYRKYRVR